jgi:hypothetical protein
MESIEYFSTKDIITELTRRFDETVIVAANRRSEKEDDVIICLGGAYHAILGLLAMAKMAAEAGDVDGTDSID